MRSDRRGERRLEGGSRAVRLRSDGGFGPPLVWLVVLLVGLACGPGAGGVDTSVETRRVAALPWDSCARGARGTTVVWRMWRGDPSINAYVDRWVAPRLRERTA
jgi:ABC-type uncharacterized transport system YnjBCD substrate-binding protein